MRYNRRHKVLFLCITINLLIFVYIFLTQHVGQFAVSNTIITNKLLGKKLSITVLIYEFEEFANDVSATVHSITSGLPNIPILIVSKGNPYPPLDVDQFDNVKVVVWEQPATNPQRQGDPKTFIQTKYVLILPDAVRLSFVERLRNLDYDALQKSHQIIGFSADNNYHCSGLKVDLRRWTMSYEERPDSNVCDSVVGDTPIALLMKTEHFFNLTEPFQRPSPEGLFVQFSLRGWQTLLHRESVFTKGKSSDVDDHIRWKMERKTQERKLDMYRRFGIKIVTQNGVEKNYGCQKNTPRCFPSIIDDMPQYVYNGRWTPPCCMRNLRKTTRYVFETLVRSGVTYWLEGGSLLGAARNSDIIPWDYDVDIGIYQHEISKCPQLKKILESNTLRFVDDQGFLWEKARDGEFYRVQFSEINHLHVDIFPFYERNGIMTKDTWFKTHRQDSEFPAHYLKPLATLDFAGIKAFVPNNYREFLELKFGKGVIENPQFPNPKKTKKNPDIL